MATGRTIGASLLTVADRKVIDLCESISNAIYTLISEDNLKKEFKNDYGKISFNRDAGSGRGGGKLQRDAICTRGRQGKAPFSNRNLRWHPLIAAEHRPDFAEEIERIEIEGENESQFLVFIVKDSNGQEVRYNPDTVYTMPKRFVTLPKHWFEHIDRLKYWNDNNWTQNSCIIPAIEACNWWDSVETYAILGIAVAVGLYGVNFNNLYNDIKSILQQQGINELPSPDFPTDMGKIIQCPICLKNISQNLSEFREGERETTWQPAWQNSKRDEGDDSSIQIMHVNPLLETEIRHTANNVRYGHRWCNVSMTDHSLEETLDFMEYIVKAHDRCR